MTDYDESWREYRRRRNLLLFAFFGYMPIVGLFAFLTVRVFHTTTPAFVAGFTWMAFYAVSGLRFQAFKCPRCGKWFFAKWWYHNMFAQKCLHCGLRKFADPTAQQG
jgi:hypothetical protein